jgi:hypothetical protein
MKLLGAKSWALWMVKIKMVKVEQKQKIIWNELPWYIKLVVINALIDLAFFAFWFYVGFIEGLGFL